MFNQYSPNMLKTYKQCPKKFWFRYVKNVIMPVDDSKFEFGKNIHALASYYLRKENIDKMEQSLTVPELEVWNYLKRVLYFSYEVINTEYTLMVKIGKYIFSGRIDALVKNDDKYFILDYKTGGAPKNAEFDFQTMIYILAVSAFFKTENVEFVYLDLKNKTETKIIYSKDVAEKYKQTLVQMAEMIEDSDFNKTCISNMCEYNKICY